MLHTSVRRVLNEAPSVLYSGHWGRFSLEEASRLLG